MKDNNEEDMIEGHTKKVSFACGNLYITINVTNGQPFRVFLKLGKSGGCQRALLESIGRLTTIMLQEQITSLDRICKTLIGISCDSGMIGRSSCMDVLARELKSFMPKEEKEDE